MVNNMDVIQEQILPTLYNLNKYIPPSLSLQAMTLYSSADTYLQSIRTAYLDPYIIGPINSLLNSPPSISSFLTLFIVLFISLKVLDYARRLVMFWVRLVIRLVFWGTVLGGGYYVYTVGWERAAREAGWVMGVLEGFVEEFLAGKQNAKGSNSGAPP